MDGGSLREAGRDGVGGGLLGTAVGKTEQNYVGNYYYGKIIRKCRELKYEASKNC